MKKKKITQVFEEPNLFKQENHKNYYIQIYKFNLN